VVRKIWILCLSFQGCLVVEHVKGKLFNILLKGIKKEKKEKKKKLRKIERLRVPIIDEIQT
jgi:hypothetical protein